MCVERHIGTQMTRMTQGEGLVICFIFCMAHIMSHMVFGVSIWGKKCLFLGFWLIGVNKFCG